MLRSNWLRQAGIFSLALMGLNLWLQVLTALLTGAFNIGRNYWGGPIGTYLTLAILLVATPVGLFKAVQFWRRAPTSAP